MKYAPYDRDADFGYAPGVFPSMELSLHAPELWRALLVHPDGFASEGVASLIQRAEALAVRVEQAPRAIERIAGKGNCYAVGVFTKRFAEPDPGRDHLVLVQPSDMGNLGTNLRTAAGFGIRDVAIVRPAADPFDPRSVRASMGAVFRARVAMYDSFEAYSQMYPRERYYFRLKNAKALATVRRPEAPADFVFGNEAAGLPDALLDADTGVRIEQSDAIDSLNLSVAVGIGLHHFMKNID